MLDALRGLADDDGIVTVGNTEIKRASAKTRRTVQYALGHLDRAGIIRIEGGPAARLGRRIVLVPNAPELPVRKPKPGRSPLKAEARARYCTLLASIHLRDVATPWEHRGQGRQPPALSVLSRPLGVTGATFCGSSIRMAVATTQTQFFEELPASAHLRQRERASDRTNERIQHVRHTPIPFRSRWLRRSSSARRWTSYHQATRNQAEKSARSSRSGPGRSHPTPLRRRRFSRAGRALEPAHPDTGRPPIPTPLFGKMNRADWMRRNGVCFLDAPDGPYVCRELEREIGDEAVRLIEVVGPDETCLVGDCGDFHEGSCDEYRAEWPRRRLSAYRRAAAREDPDRPGLDPDRR